MFLHTCTSNFVESQWIPTCLKYSEAESDGAPFFGAEPVLCAPSVAYAIDEKVTFPQAALR
jgi:hypothetical protein